MDSWVGVDACVCVCVCLITNKHN